LSSIRSGVEGLKRAVLLDTSAFIVGYEASDLTVEQYTVPPVLDELSEEGLPRIRLENAIRNGRVKVVPPEPGYVAEIEAIIAEMGEKGVLSETDAELLALGLQMKATDHEAVIVSEDYSVQNIADHLGLEFRALATPGIRRRLVWMTYCPGCRGTFGELKPGGACPICGTTLKRKPVKKSEIERR
jgi:UPF0271 protein